MYEQLQSAVVETETVWPNIHKLLFTGKVYHHLLHRIMSLCLGIAC